MKNSITKIFAPVITAAALTFAPSTDVNAQQPYGNSKIVVSKDGKTTEYYNYTVVKGPEGTNIYPAHSIGSHFRHQPSAIQHFPVQKEGWINGWTPGDKVKAWHKSRQERKEAGDWYAGKHALHTVGATARFAGSTIDTTLNFGGNLLHGVGNFLTDLTDFNQDRSYNNCRRREF